MEVALILAIAMALLFALTNGFHDAANAIATLVATRVASPGRAILMASVFNMAGPLFFGAAVANTIAKIVDVPSADAIPVIGAGLTGAVIWNTYTWRKGLPSSSSHALVGGLMGAALLSAGADAVNWGGMDGAHPKGVYGTLISLALASVITLIVAFCLSRLMVAVGRRLTRRANGPVKSLQWVASSWLAFSHGSNDAMKTVGIIAALLLASGHATTLDPPLWAIFAAAGMLTLGTAMGGWSIVKTIGKRIFPLRPLDGLVSQTTSASLILIASALGAPVSTTQVVSASVVGIGIGRRRWRHVDWAIVKDIGLAWLTTMPAAGLLGALALPLWRLIP